MQPDEIIDPPPAWARNAWIAGTTPRDMDAARRTCGAATHTPPTGPRLREVKTGPDATGPLPFGDSRPHTTTGPESRHRIGWSLVLMCLAETIVFVTAVATGAYVIGLAAVASMFVCGLFLIAAESISATRRTDR